MGNVVIVGAGIAGLASAIALAGRGHSVRVFEQADAIAEVGAGLQIGPNARRALEELGVWSRLAPRTVAPEAIELCNGLSGACVQRVELGERFAARFGAPYQVAHRADLIAALAAGADDSDAVTVTTGARVEAVDASAPRPLVRLADGEEITADIVIGADGVRSQVRRSVIGDGDSTYSGYVMYRALVDLHEDQRSALTSTVRAWMLPGAHVVHYPVSAGQKLNIVAVKTDPWRDEGWSVPAGSGEVETAFAAAAAALRDILHRPRRWLKWAGLTRPPSTRWNRATTTLIGDAAHPTLPFLAQGAAMALEDAVVLAQAIGRRADGFEQALAEFVAERAARANRLVAASARQGRLYHLPRPANLVRDVALRAIGPAGVLERMAWLYRWPAR